MAFRARRSLETRICKAFIGSTGRFASDHSRSTSSVAGIVRPGLSTSWASRARSAVPGNFTGAPPTRTSIGPSSPYRTWFTTFLSLDLHRAPRLGRRAILRAGAPGYAVVHLLFAWVAIRLVLGARSEPATGRGALAELAGDPAPPPSVS